MKKLAVSFLIVTILLPCISFAQSNNQNAWLFGKWELYYDPDGSPKDYLYFNENGTFVSKFPDHSDIEGTYIVTKEKVIMNVQVKGRACN